MSATELRVDLLHPYHNNETATSVRGPQTFAIAPGGKVERQGKLFDSLDFVPAESDAAYEVCDVVIGVTSTGNAVKTSVSAVNSASSSKATNSRP